MQKFYSSNSEKSSEVFTINCTVQRGITKDEIWHKLYDILKTSLALRDLGIQQHNMSLTDEMLCYENTTLTNNVTFYWPMTKIGTNVTIPCHTNVATRHWFVCFVLFLLLKL
ncbi:uncharacterized protein LOC128251448 isoform X2 [Octopus bimaculoides]|uniref:uncharacterized protein LOC128251448 isoform X2 n=1 Tax=Octopus bimaculoides TaxID=37653 RepID=UPI0022DF8920|nr:uncharacterized protein LOC128251448 isoform X2 [Octopus bimaculoides]